MEKKLEKWHVFESGKVVDTIEFESYGIRDGIFTFSKGNEIVAVTALGGGIILRPAEDTYIDPDSVLM